jgi:hypothetical protein
LVRSRQSHHPTSDKEHTVGWVIGLDVHKDTIAAATLNPAGELAGEAVFAGNARLLDEVKRIRERIEQA